MREKIILGLGMILGLELGYAFFVIKHWLPITLVIIITIKTLFDGGLTQSRRKVKR